MSILFVLFVGLGIHAQSRPTNRIRFSGEVTEESVTEATQAIGTALHDGAHYVLFEINSPGGDVDAGFVLTKTIEDSPVPVICIVDGEGMSMAAYILQSCTVRLMTPRSLLMLHKPAIGGSIHGDDARFAGIADYLHHASEAMLNQFAARMTIPKDEIRRRIEHGDWYLSADEAEAVGAVDGVVPSVAFVAARLEQLDR